MSQLAAVLPFVGAALSARQTLLEGKQEEQASKIEAIQLKRQADADMADAVQRAKQERRKARILESRARAVGAASGTDVTSPDIQRTLAGIDQQGEFNALAVLHTGVSSSRSKQLASDLARQRGKQARKASKQKATGKLISSLGSIYG